jgi:16S rRNA processing protein RimM
VPADLVELGVVRGAYGVQGWARIAPHDAQASVLRRAARWWLRGRGGERQVTVGALRRHGDLLLAKWRGCDRPEEIDALRGAVVCVARSEFPPLPAGEYYWTDLVGLKVVNRQGDCLGHVSEVMSNGVHELIRVAAVESSLLVPLVAAYVDEVDLAARVIRVDWQADWS